MTILTIAAATLMTSIKVRFRILYNWALPFTMSLIYLLIAMGSAEPVCAIEDYYSTETPKHVPPNDPAATTNIVQITAKLAEVGGSGHLRAWQSSGTVVEMAGVTPGTVVLGAGHGVCFTAGSDEDMAKPAFYTISQNGKDYSALGVYYPGYWDGVNKR